MRELGVSRFREAAQRWAFLAVWAALLTGCENAVFGTIAPAAGKSPAPAPSDPVDSAEAPGADGSGPSVGTIDEEPTGGASLPLRTCEGVRMSCRSPIKTADVLPGRALPEVQTLVAETISLQRIFEKFDTACGRCHAPPEVPGEKNGDWVVQGANGLLADPAIWDEAIERIESLDPEVAMPPTRDPSKPLPESLRDLLETLREWSANGRVDTGFTHATSVSAETPYRFSDDVRANMTNLGNCIPDPSIVGCAGSEIRMLDAKFARMKSFSDLPKTLQDTDMFTLDSALLAEHRVLSYAPTYTLFSDNAKKMRYVRVPDGQTVSYDAATHEFSIPENTRFYKTFLRHVVDKTGKSSYRKVETRIIVSRKDAVENGVATPQAIFGTYLWSLDEARAELAELPYNDQTPFRDVPLRHIVDERRALRAGADAGVTASMDPDTLDGIAAAFERDHAVRAEEPLDFLDDTQLLTRGYAVPGRDRCIQCHMGSSNQSFILGFSPYHADRRAGTEGGVFDAPAGDDELTQLQRLIDYGVVVDSTPALSSAPGTPATRHRLEESEGDRQARNEFELKAQGYMMGNCAFCHNPSGFPSVENPVLKDVLSFFPRSETGGIFEFPLDRFSPRTSRTPAFNVRFPYITPSLFERIGGAETEDGKGFVPPKSFVLAGKSYYVAAPWRSLLYRNVQTPFTYAHDEAIHPHMPLNVPGYDFRTAQIMGDWMLSIPARLQDGAQNRTDYLGLDQPWVEVRPGEDGYDFEAYKEVGLLRREAFRSPRMITKDELDAACADIAARYPGSPALLHDCTDGHDVAGMGGYFGGASVRPDTSDVVAPEMSGPLPLDSPYDRAFLIVRSEDPACACNLNARLGAPDSCAACPSALISQDPVQLGTRFGNAVRWQDGIPDRPNWVLRDLTSIPGRWSPRGSRWDTALRNIADFVPPPRDLSVLSPDEREREQRQQEIRRQSAERVFHLQEHFKVSDELHHFAIDDRPYGLWQEPPTGQSAPGSEARCEELLPVAPKVQDLKAAPPRWFEESSIDPDDPADRSRLIYTQPPGETLFSLICINCHGKAADGNSLLANTILELTGGRTRVANLRDGIFGADGANREEVFHDDDLAVRYLLWMGLGGTQATIPAVVLNRVGATRPLGVDRKDNPNAQATANMLDNAIGFCKDSIGLGLGFDHRTLGPGVPEYDPTHSRAANSSLVASNGDAELWVRVCGIDNPGPIRAIQFVDIPPGHDEELPSFSVASAYWRDLDGVPQMPADVRIGDHHGRVRVGLEPDNLSPWCVLRPKSVDEAQDAKDLAALLQAWHSRPGRANEEPPWCPESLFVGAGPVSARFKVLEVAPLGVPDERRDTWATHGAMNVGASVFTYLDALSRAVVKSKPGYDACALPATAR